MNTLPKLDIHTFAELFPQMTPDEWETFVADIHENGVLTPITLFQGKILDGRHRWTAIEEICEKHGMEAKPACNFTIFEGTEAEALAYAYSANIHRRHLTTGQRACLGVEVKRHLQETAVKHGGDRRSEEFQECNFAQLKDAAQIAADTVNVSRRSVFTAEKIQEEAPDLFERVRAGEMPLGAAETALAVRNGTQTQQQAIRACVSEVIQSIGADAVTEEKLDKVSRVLAGDSKAHVANNSGVQEWYTPEYIVMAARDVLCSIDLDPASCEQAQETVRAERYFTLEQDGLAQEWSGNTWMNPPYTQGVIDLFIAKLCKHFAAGDIPEAIVLTNNATETAWFQLLSVHASAICFPQGRIKFLSPMGEEGQPLQGQAITYLGQHPSAFIQVFEQFGFCVLGNEGFLSKEIVDHDENEDED